MNNDTAWALFVMLVAAVGVILLITCVPAPARDVCLTKREARQLWPRQHIYWYSADHCWSDRRGPPRNIKVEPDEPKAKKIKTDQITKAAIKTVDPMDVNELDAMAMEEPTPFVTLSDRLQGWAMWWASRVGEVFK